MFERNTDITGFTFGLVSRVDGTVITSGTVTGFYTLDGGTQSSITDVPTHEGNGQWSVNLTSAEMNGDMVGLFFTHTNSIPASFTVKTKVAATINSAIALQVETQLSDDFAAIPTAVSTVDKEDIAARVESHLLDEADGQLLINAIVGAIGNTNLSEVSVVAAVRADLERVGGTLKLMEADLNNPTQYMADVSNLSADVNVIEVNGVAVTNINEFKADITNLATAASITALKDFDPLLDIVANVALVDKTTTNTDMVAAAPLASTIALAVEAILVDEFAVVNTNISTADVNILVAAIKVRTDQMIFTKLNELDVNIKSQNSATLLGIGVDGDRWRGS